jgi:leucyl aminopeptidase
LPAPDIKFQITSEHMPQLHTEGCEALVFCLSDDFKAVLTGFSAPITHVIQQAISRLTGTGALSLEMVIPTMGLHPIPNLIVCYNKDSMLTLQRMRELGAHTARLAAQHHYHQIAIDLTSCLLAASSLTIEACAGAWTEGIGLGSYSIQSYQQSDAGASNPLQCVELIIQEDHNPVRLEQAITEAITLSDATNYARDLTNMPSNMLTPSTLANEAMKLADLGGMICHILEETEIKSFGMGGLSAVGQGSAHKPRMIVLNYKGSQQSDTVYGLIGKGITFDTGGISLKKADGMEEMINDMGGAAVVLGVMQALSRMKLKLNVVAVIPAAENMPSGSAYKPGDIITSMSGRTIEVLNTDAEGRIVLADAMTYARQLGATKLIDVATLTGAVLVALGDVATAAITNNDVFLDKFMKAAERSGEKVWQLPVYPEYREMLKSSVADLKNSTGNRLAGAITAGLFIGTFADDIPWIHLDTGGTAWLWKARGMDPQGATGAMVRTLLHYLNDPNAIS